MKAARLALLALACTLPLAATAQWMWVDKDGRKVFSDKAPPPEIPADKVLRGPKGQRLVPAATTETAAVPTAAAVPELPKPSGKDKALEERRKQAEAAEAEKKKAEQQKVAQLREENCNRAKASKANFDSGMRISRTNANGEREIL